MLLQKLIQFVHEDLETLRDVHIPYALKRNPSAVANLRHELKYQSASLEKIKHATQEQLDAVLDSSFDGEDLESIVKRLGSLVKG